MKSIDSLIEENNQLRQRNILLEQIVRSVPISIAITSWEGNILWCNEEMALLFGGTVESLQNCRISTFYHDNDQRQRLLMELRKRRHVRHFELSAQNLQGELFELRGSVSQIKYENQPALIGIMENITAQQEARRIIERTKRSQNMAHAFGNLAHDFRNNLCAIQIQLQTIIYQPSNSSLLVDKAQKILNTTRKASELVEKMDDYTGARQFIMKQCAVLEIVRECIDQIQLSAPKSVKIDYTVDREIPIIMVDSSAIERILLNLLINAIHTIGDSLGNVKIKATQRLLSPSQLNQYINYSNYKLDAGSYVAIAVKDTGSGISKENMLKIFEPCFTTKGNDGTGMGLASAQGIMGQHNGGIFVESVMGEGTEITLLFPIGILS